MTEESFKRKLTAILSADVEGYSRLMGEDEDATIRTLTTYRDLMSTLIQKHRGRVVDSPGDNLLAEFLSVVDAVRCAVEIQEELRVRNAELPENRRMQFRIGVNLGDVVEEEERIYGDGINIAARVEGLAEGGGICISGTVYDSIKNKLTLSYEPLGEHTVKNIKEPVRVYRMRVGPETAAPVVTAEKAGLRTWQKATLAAVAVLVVVVGALAIWNFYFRPPPIEPASVEKMAYQLPEKPSLAVLPFDNLSGDKDQDYIADGLTENIIDALSKMPEMFIAARHSTLTYKGKQVKIRQIAEDLGVQYVLEGSVQKSRERLRVTAQLIDALKGHHVWSEKYDRKLKELFALQDDITLNIAIAMELKLTEGEQALMRHSTDNLEAWSLASKAKGLFETYRMDKNLKARELLKKAVELDPNYAYAWVYLAWTHFIDGYIYPSHYDRKESFKKASEIVQKVLSIDDKLSDAYAILSFAYITQRKFDEALAAGKKAIALGPNDSENHAIVAIVMQYLGDGEAMVSLINKAMRLDPHYPPWYLYRLSIANGLLGRYEEAEVLMKKHVEIVEKAHGPAYGSYLLLARYCVMMGRMEEAKAYVAKTLEGRPGFCIEGARKFESQLYKDPEILEKYLEALRKAGLPEHPPLPLPDKPSIAVLPFVNMSGDPEQEYVSDGVTEEIITALSKTPKLFVIARTSSFRYKGKEVDVRTIGRELGVKYVMEGSVRKAGDKVRITAQLIDAKTNKHLWAERYDRELKGIFALQDEITMKVINALQVELTEGEHARLWGKGTDNLDAYIKSLRAREHYLTQTKEGNALARRTAEEAIALDPEYAPPYHFLAVTHFMDVLLGTTKSPKESLIQAIELTQKAISLDNSYALGHGFLGVLYTMLRKPEKGVVAAQKCVALDPNGAHGYLYLSGALRLAGKSKEAVQPIEKAIRLNPFPPVTYFRGAIMAYIGAGSYEKAIGAGKRAINIGPDEIMSHLALTVAYSLAGREEEARSAAEEVLRINPKFSINLLGKRLVYWKEGQLEQFLTALRKAGLPE